MILAQDPDELFDVVDARGNPTGRVKRRADVHRDGDWHRAIHVWVIGMNVEGSYILFQRRGLDKDTWPGELDCTVGGHLGTGEAVSDAYREVEEEIGVAVEPEGLRSVGVRIAVNEQPGLYLDREIQYIFFLRDERDLTAFQPNPHELESLVHISLDDLLDLFVGERESIEATQCLAKSTAIERLRLTMSDFVPVTDRYFYRVAIAARNALRGDRHVAV